MKQSNKTLIIECQLMNTEYHLEILTKNLSNFLQNYLKTKITNKYILAINLLINCQRNNHSMIQG